MFLQSASMKILGQVKGTALFFAYSSPMVFVAGVCLLLFFQWICFESDRINKLISVFSAATLGVYLIHDNILVRQNIVKGLSLPFLQSSFLLMFFEVMGLAITIYVLCSVVEMVRLKMFKVLHIDSAIMYVANRIEANLGGFFEELYSKLGEKNIVFPK